MTGYHANDKKRCTRFVKDNNYLIISEDINYLGSGMYFWEYESRAVWWKKEKNKESIVKAGLNLDSMLDLADPEIIKIVEQTANYLQTSIERKGIRQNQLGKRIDYLFEGFSKRLSQYNSIRGISQTKREESAFLYNTKITGTCDIIYCIRRSGASLVTKREMIL